jgi:hypothetical protein
MLKESGYDMKVTPFLHAPLRSWVIVFSRTCFFKRVAHLKKNNPVSVNAKRCTRAADIEPGSRQTRLKMWSLHDRGKIGRGRTKSTERERALAGYSLWDIWWFIGVFGAEVEHILTCNAMECLVFPFLYCWRWFVVYGCIALAWMLMLHAVLFPSHARD